MTIVLITCYNDFFLILVNQLKEGTQHRQNVCHYSNVSTQSWNKQLNLKKTFLWIWILVAEDLLSSVSLEA